jgi:hypothetical protein
MLQLALQRQRRLDYLRNKKSKNILIPRLLLLSLPKKSMMNKPIKRTKRRRTRARKEVNRHQHKAKMMLASQSN